MPHQTLKLFALSLPIIFWTFAGCSSSGGDSAQTQDDRHLIIGKFIDDPVQGLDYTCSSGMADKTDKNGLYICKSGDDVTFKVGPALIGTVAAQESFITPYDFFEDETAAVDLARLLQTLDADGDADNGVIIINEADVSSLPSDLDFTSDDFEERVLVSSNIELIDAIQAKHHLDDVIAIARGDVPNEQADLHADAGRLQNIKTGSDVTLDGSSSHFDGNGGELTYAWKFISVPSGSEASLSNATLVDPHFTADQDGRYVLRLTIDHDGNTTTDSVVITAATSNSTPVANAGSDQYVKTETEVTLDGSRSTDADDDILTYHWSLATKAIGSLTQLSDPTSETPSFTADRDGTYVLDLSVSDETSISIVDKVSITASSGNSRPVANAGVNQDVVIGNDVFLDGSRSTDADDDTLSYRWVFTSKAPNSDSVLSDTAIESPTFHADKEGTYVLHLTVDDGQMESSVDKVTITATP